MGNKRIFGDDKFFRVYAKNQTEKSLPSGDYDTGAHDEYPLSYLRINIVLSQFDEFYETYDPKAGDGMYIAPEDRIKIW